MADPTPTATAEHGAWRRRAARSVAMALLALATFVIGMAAEIRAAEASRRVSYMVVDAETGHVLRSSRSRLARHPASLTKMMTLYLAFEALEAGRLEPDQTLVTSRHAASMPPSELGLKRGDRITVREAIRASAVRSANDAAVVLAEAIDGYESVFAERMTRTARRLGMRETTFRNATGLTARGHMSSARDMAILARRLHADYPEYYHLFSRARVRFRGRTHRATNRLLGRGGVDGIKTGYTRAAGYNLAASAHRDGRRVIVVLLNASSSQRRNRSVASLLDDGFARLKRREAAGDLVALETAPRPHRRPSRRRPAPEPERGEMRQIAAAARPEPDGALRGSVINAWAVQVGAFLSRNAANHHMRAIASFDTPELRSSYRNVTTARLPGTRGADARTVHRVRFTGLSEQDARGACHGLTRRKQPCALVPPLGWGG